MAVLTQLQQALSPYIPRLVRQGSSLETKPVRKNVVVAYSGGVDSHVLLHACWQLQSQFPDLCFSAIHINHGLSQQADQWQAHCQAVCQQLAIPLQCANVQVDLAHPQGLEAAARAVRYQRIAELCPPDALLLLAQHQDDQAETLLLQLKRGAGPKGLAAMAEVSRTEAFAVLRPFLHLSQQSILAYAEQHQLSWQEDDSNRNLRFDRNFLRLQILPLLTQRWPEFNQALTRSAALCAEQQSLLEEAAREKLQALPDGRLPIVPLLQLSESWQKQVLRCWCGDRGVPMPSREILTQLVASAQAKADAEPLVSWQDWQCRRYQQHLYLMPTLAAVPKAPFIWRDVTQPLTTPLGVLSWLGSQEIDRAAVAPLQVQFDHRGFRFKPRGAGGSKPIKQWYKQWCIPPWLRPLQPVVLYQEQVLAVAEHISEDASALLSLDSVQLRWDPIKQGN